MVTFFWFENGHADDVEIVGHHKEINMTRLKLVHTGEILEHEFIEPFGLSSHRIAKNIGVKPARINEIVRARRGITAEKALRLS